MESTSAAEAVQMAADNDASSSSRGSTPEVQRRRGNVNATFYNSANDTHKPILAPRSAPPPIPVRTTSNEGVTVALRKQFTGRCLYRRIFISIVKKKKSTTDSFPNYL